MASEAVNNLMEITGGVLAVLAATLPIVLARRGSSSDKGEAPPAPPPVDQWPSSTDYTAAVANPGSAFLDPELRTAVVTNAPTGLPGAVRGESAVVFRLTVRGEPRAVRCFLAESPDGGARYQAIERHLQRHPCPDVVPAWWLDEGIVVHRRPWPVVVMPWVAEQHLDSAVDEERDSPERLRRLAESWRATVGRLEASGLVHGDLQHGNVLVDDDLGMKLIDLDGAWVPGGNAAAPYEVGHPHYQHPKRTRADWGPGIDSFSALLIYTSLRALAVDPSLLWCSSTESLLFVRPDLLHPGETAVWDRLGGLPDPEVRQLVAVLGELCRAPEAPRQPFGVHVDRAARLAGSTVAADPHPPAAHRLPEPAGDTWWDTAHPGPTPPLVRPQPSSPPLATGPGRVAPPRPAEEIWWYPTDGDDSDDSDDSDGSGESGTAVVS